MTSSPPARLRRVDTWLGREGAGLVPISWDAAVLLDRRLRVRSRSKTVVLPVLLLAAAAYVVGLQKSHFRTGDINDPAARWWALWCVFMALAVVTRQFAVARGERALAATLPRRVTVGSSTSLISRLGRARFAGLCVAVTAPFVVLAALVVLGGSFTLVGTYAVVLCVVLGCTAESVRQVLIGPRIAVDAASLEIDRRVRARDVADSCCPLSVIVASAYVPIGLLGYGGGALGLAALAFPMVALTSALIENTAQRGAVVALIGDAR